MHRVLWGFAIAQSKRKKRFGKSQLPSYDVKATPIERLSYNERILM